MSISPLSYSLCQIAVVPLFASLHNEPRWELFLVKIGRSPKQLAAIEFNVTLPT